MKTKNNTRKTNLKLLAVITCFILISFTASTQDFQHSIAENETTKEMALANYDSHHTFKTTSSIVAETVDLNGTDIYSETELESKMELEEWMTNDKTFQVQEKPEKKIVIKKLTFIFVEAKDPELVFEKWMFDPKIWSIRK